MKNTFRLFSFCLFVAATRAFAGTGSESSMAETATEAPPFPFEFDAEFTYIADSTVERGSREIRDFDETYSLLRFIYTPRIKFGILRLGVASERFGFGLPANVQLESTLQSVSAIVGLDTQLSDSILIRFEAQPGLYGSDDDLDGDTFNVPFVLGGTYIYSPSLQFVFGVSINYEREFPVFPGGGIRWRFAPQWVLNAVVPTPRLEFEANKNLTVYLGANLKGSTFRVDENFGSRQAGDTQLNNAVISYLEIRTGAGVEIKLSPQTKLSFEGGYVPFREFDYHRTNVRYHHEEGAAYGTVAFRAAF